MLKTIVGAVVAAALSTTPAMAAANPASPLSLVKSVRTGTQTSDQAALAGRRGGLIIGGIAAIAIIVGIIIIADDNDNSSSR